jgi:regulatory protein
MKITKIEVQVKKKDRYSVFVDEKFAFGISELGLINSGLRLGQEITKEELNSLKEEAKNDKIYNQALALFARRPRSRWEITDYLKRKGVEENTVQEILNTLSIKGFINDEDFARRWVENRRLIKSISKRKLKLELKQKRIDEEIILNVLAEDETDEIDVLRSEIAKKRRQSRYQDDQKLIAYLARQGFNYGDIKEAMDSLKMDSKD